MPPDPEVTLKEFMEVRFTGLEKKVDRLDTKVEALEAVADDVKHVIRMWRYIGGLIVGVLLILATAWLRQKLGI